METFMRSKRKASFALIALLACLMPAAAQQASDARVADLAQSGKLRVGLFPPQYVKDTTTGRPKSAWVEIARALAAQIGVEPVLVEHPTPIKDIECLKARECDVILLPFDARAADVGDFSSPYMQFEYTLLVPAGSSIRRFEDADRAGVRIAAVRNHASTNTLAPLLKRAELVYAETPDPAFDLLRDGKAQVMASTRPTLLDYSAQLPGSRVLDDHYGANLNRIVILKGNAARLAYINEFVEHAKASGLVQKAIDSAGPVGLTVAPPGDSN
jgi:polar amino acid transport system substrate-binding protein